MRTLCPKEIFESKARLSLRLRTICPRTSDMSQITSFRSVIELWPSREAMASDLRIGASAVSKWWQRNRIPPEWWSAVIETDRAGSANVTAETLTTLAAREPAEARA